MKFELLWRTLKIVVIKKYYLGKNHIGLHFWDTWLVPGTAVRECVICGKTQQFSPWNQKFTIFDFSADLMSMHRK